ncbi:MAG: DUF1064 domain-containing protein [Planctomycetota bacterium]
MPRRRGNPLAIGHQFKRGARINAKPTIVDGFRFDSKAEAEYYVGLKLRRDAGEIIQFLRQVPFHLPGNVRYVVDFVEFHADGTVHFVDVKGMETEMFKLKRKQVEELYAPIKIEIYKPPR